MYHLGVLFRNSTPLRGLARIACVYQEQDAPAELKATRRNGVPVPVEVVIGKSGHDRVDDGDGRPGKKLLPSRPGQESTGWLHL